MTWPRENPAPVRAGGRASEIVLVARLDVSDNSGIPASRQPEAVPPGLDPELHPILWRHWFGLPPLLGEAAE